MLLSYLDHDKRVPIGVRRLWLARTGWRDDVIAPFEPINVRLGVAAETAVQSDVMADGDCAIAWRLRDHRHKRVARWTNVQFSNQIKLIKVQGTSCHLQWPIKNVHNSDDHGSATKAWFSMQLAKFTLVSSYMYDY